MVAQLFCGFSRFVCHALLLVLVGYSPLYEYENVFFLCALAVEYNVFILSGYHRVGWLDGIVFVGDFDFLIGDGELIFFCLMVEHKKERWEKGGRGTF